MLFRSRAEGWLPDPREPLPPPQAFASQVELRGRTEHTAVLLDAAGVLLARLSAWARAQQARVQRFVLTLHHETRLRASAQGDAGAHCSTRVIALAEPTADAAHWQAVLRERLAREPLPAPVISLSLSCDEPVHSPAPEAELFPAPASEHESLLRLLERLQARLGDEGLQRLASCDDHRPEHASATQPVLSRREGPQACPPSQIGRAHV